MQWKFGNRMSKFRFQYKAVAVNCAGEAETTARISLHQTPPTFGKRLEKSEDVNEGEPLELKAKINGSPRPQVAWYKDGDLIPSDDDRVKTSILPDGTVKLNIESVVPSDSGAYKLVISNPMGEIAGLCAVAVNRNYIVKFLCTIANLINSFF